MREKRIFERYCEKSLAVINYYTRAGTSLKSDFFANTHDLSMTGARLVSPHYFPVKTNMIVSLDLASVKRYAQLWAEVKWIEKRQTMNVYDMGLEFVHSADPLGDFIKRFGSS